MKKIFVLVEGFTEEKFIKEVLSEFLINKEIFIEPIIVTTKKLTSGKKIKGGISKFSKIEKELKSLLNDSSVDIVTTMLDYYGLGSDCPGKSEATNTNCYINVEIIEKKLSDHFDNRKFLPYIQLHEFETLLYSDIKIIQEHFIEYPECRELDKVIEKFPNPELINDNENTAPSKRLEKIFPNYGKTSDGIIIVKKIGLDKILAECRHFDEWIEKLLG